MSTHRYLLRIDWLLSTRFVGTPSRRKCSGATIGQNYPVIRVNISFGLIGGWFVDFWSFKGGAMDWWKLVKGGRLSPLIGRSGSSFSPLENDIGVVTENWLLQVIWPGLKIWMVWVERVDGKGWHVAIGCLHAAFACCSHASTSPLQTHSYGGSMEAQPHMYYPGRFWKCPGKPLVVDERRLLITQVGSALLILFFHLCSGTHCHGLWRCVVNS